MLKVTAYGSDGTKKDAQVNLDEAIFGLTPNHELLSLAYRSYLAAGRAVSAQTKTRGLIRGGGRKPWRQKGTGRARVGSIRVPNWRGGGVVFGPTNERNYSINLPLKMKRLAIRQALSAQAQNGQLMIMDDFKSSDGKVKSTLEVFQKLKLEGFILLVVAEREAMLDRATRNIIQLQVKTAGYLNVYDILNADQIIMTKAALEMINKKPDGSKKSIPAAKPKAAARPAKVKKARPTAKKLVKAAGDSV